MKKQRKENNNKVNVFKVLVKAILISIVFAVICVGIAISFLVWAVGGIENFLPMTVQVKKLVVLVLLFEFSFAYLIILYITFHEIMSNEKGKISKMLAEDILSKDTYIEVYPKQGHLRYYQHFFYTELPARAKYFAILSKDENEIVIVLKFDKYDEYIFLERIEKESFKNAYEVVETTQPAE